MKRITKAMAFFLAFALLLSCGMSALTGMSHGAITVTAAEESDGTEGAAEEKTGSAETAKDADDTTEPAATYAENTAATYGSAESPDYTVTAGDTLTITLTSSSQGPGNNRTYQVVDTDGNEVTTITASQSGSGSYENSTLTVTTSEDTEPGIYIIQYTSSNGGGSGGPGGSGSSGSTSYTTLYYIQVNAYVWSSGVDGEITKGNGGGSDTTVTEPTPGITKTATKAEGEDDYTYDLALTVSSDVGSSESKVTVDLLFIIDISKSMENSSLMDPTKEAVTGLVASLETNENLDMQYAVVTFSGSTDNNGTYDDATTVQNWTGDANAVNTSVNAITATGGTNYEAGLREGKSVLLKAREDALKYVIFLSDGMPGYYYNGSGYTTGTGNSEDNANATADAHAQNMVKELKGVNGFYTVYLGSKGQQYLENLTTALQSVDPSVSVGNETYTSGSDDLSAIFAKLVKNFTEVSCTNATITDTLSEWVVPVEGATPYVVIKVTDENGSVTTYSTKDDGILPDDEKNITASYDSETKVLKLDFPATYNLKEGYVYEVHLDIQPSEQAIQNGIDYPNTADAGTGTHSGQLGYYSNTGATLTYTLTDDTEEKSVKYPMPVVQVRPTTTVTITKLVTGNMGDTSKKFNFTVTCDSPMGAATDGSYTLSDDGKTATFTLADGNAVTLDRVKKGSIITITEEFSSYTMTVMVGDTKLTADTEGNYTYTVPKDGTTLSITVTNHKEAIVDTGVLLDVVPYVVTLAAVAVCVVILVIRHREDGERE